MFKLPICPHCGTVYRYRDTEKAIRQKDNECYHCHKRFKAKIFPYMLVEAIVFVVISIGFNLLILSRMYRFSFVPLFAVTLVFLLIIRLLIPFFTHFKKTESSEKKSIQKNKTKSQKKYIKSQSNQKKKK